MTPDEIVRALRENADWCGANEYEIPLCMGDNQREAADLIESLQSKLAASQRREQAAVEDLNGTGACFTGSMVGALLMESLAQMIPFVLPVSNLLPSLCDILCAASCESSIYSASASISLTFSLLSAP